MKNFEHIKLLSKSKSMKAINQLSPAAFPGNHCPMHTSLAIASRIKGVSTLVIGATECGYYSRNLVETSEFKEHALHWCYILDENEVVFGCRKGVIQAIKKMESEGAKVILLIFTCVPEVVGEDLDGIVFEVEKDIKAKILGVGLGNFKCGSQQPGFWKTLLAFGQLAKNSVQNKNIINVLGRSKDENHIPKPKIIEILEQNYEIRYVAPNSTVEEFEKINEGLVNLVFSPFLMPLAEFLEVEFGVPFISFHSTYEVEEVKENYEKLFHILEKDIDQRVFEHYEMALNLQNEVTKIVSGKRYVGSKIGAIQPLPFHRYLAKLGMMPLMIHMEDFYTNDTYWREKMLEENQDPLLCMMVNDYSDKEYILALQPDYIVGDWIGRTEFKEKTIQVMHCYGLGGFELTINLLKQMKGGNA